jgi:hypothetical protein
MLHPNFGHGGQGTRRRRGSSSAPHPPSSSATNDSGESSPPVSVSSPSGSSVSSASDSAAAARSLEGAPKPGAFRTPDTAARAAAKSSGPPFKILNQRAQPWLSGAFQALVHCSWLRCTFSILGLLAGVSVVFALLYLPLSAQFSCDSGSASATAEDLVWFSIGMTTTAGGGLRECRPQQRFALVLTNIHAIVIQMVLVFTTGVAFTRLTLPSSFLRSCEFLVFGCPVTGGRGLATRIIFEDPDIVIIDCKIDAQYRRYVKVLHSP